LGASLFSTLCDPDTNYDQERIVVGINSVEHKFLLERRKSAINSKKISFSVWGRSKGALLDVPFSNPFKEGDDIVDDVAENTYYASEIINKAITASGKSVSVTFSIHDYQVFAGSYTIEGKSPIEVIKDLAEVPGGRVRSRKNGNLIVDYKPYNPAFITPAIEYSEVDTILQLDETIVRPPGYNRVRVVGDEEAGVRSDASIQMELDPDEDLDCIEINQDFNLRVYASPFSLQYEFDQNIGTFTHVGTYESEHTEEIIIQNGAGATQYPIKSVVSYSWHGNNIGNIETQNGYKNINVLLAEGETDYPHAGYGVLTITYKSEYTLYVGNVNLPGTALAYAIEQVEE
jgi:hypothetical protein